MSDLAGLAKDAYVFGYPLVYDLSEVVSATTHPRMAIGAPANLFAHATELAGPRDRFVSVNNDTLYSLAQCDVTDEPLVLRVPDTDGRYYVMQFVDAWTNNFAYVGRRATGTAEGAYVLAGPGWNGASPDGLPVIKAPTNVFSIVGRFAVSGRDDVPTVAALQAETWVTPLSRYPQPPEQAGRAMGDRELAPYDTNVPETLAFWEQLRAWMALFPPAAGDLPFVETLAPLGLLEGSSPYVDADAGLADVLREGAQAGKDFVEETIRKGQGTPVNGWSSALHSFDYNLDYFEIGTVDSPEWRIANRREAYVHRAAAARAGLWGNHGYEAAYAWVYADDRGEQLTGSRTYSIHLSQMPPVDAFWSLTMYDMPDYYLIENPVDRYSIGDRTPGLRRNDDGSLDLYLQRDSPEADTESNWLPTPSGDFRPLVRMYQPRAEVLTGAYELPSVVRVT